LRRHRKGQDGATNQSEVEGRSTPENTNKTQGVGSQGSGVAWLWRRVDFEGDHSRFRPEARPDPASRPEARPDPAFRTETRSGSDPWSEAHSRRQQTSANGDSEQTSDPANSSSASGGPGRALNPALGGRGGAPSTTPTPQGTGGGVSIMGAAKRQGRHRGRDTDHRQLSGQTAEARRETTPTPHVKRPPPKQ